MEHFKNPFGPGDFLGDSARENRVFFDAMLARARSHRYFSHPFLSLHGAALPSPERAASILTSVYQLVVPFTGLLCCLGGRAPSLRARFALMDNLHEEMGCGELSQAHPSLYLKMLASIGITEAQADAAPRLTSIRRINEHLRTVVERRPFAVGCALLASAEAVIAPTFPVLATLAQHASHGADMAFFDRHGPRDDGHAGDAAMLFIVSAERAHFAAVEDELMLDLDYRVDLLDEWLEPPAERPRALAEPIPVISARNAPGALDEIGG